VSFAALGSTTSPPGINAFSDGTHFYEAIVVEVV
jgi:hypothetical protein